MLDETEAADDMRAYLIDRIHKTRTEGLDAREVELDGREQELRRREAELDIRETRLGMRGNSLVAKEVQFGVRLVEQTAREMEFLEEEKKCGVGCREGKVGGEQEDGDDGESELETKKAILADQSRHLEALYRESLARTETMLAVLGARLEGQEHGSLTASSHEELDSASEQNSSCEADAQHSVSVEDLSDAFLDEVIEQHT